MKRKKVKHISEYSDEFRKNTVSEIDKKQRSLMGQFMTPPRIAEFMVSLFNNLQARDLRLLDPGAGVGALSAAFVEQLLKGKRDTKLNITAFEADPTLHKALKKVLNRAKKEMGDVNIDSVLEIRREDFIHASCISMKDDLFSCGSDHSNYTNVIMNPPYKKINSSSPHRNDLRTIGIESTNLYTAFMELSINMLEDNGEIVAIVPRSFCNGLYFRPFRKFLYDNVSFKHIHIFHSRKKAFKEDKVLQENIIFHAVKGGAKDKITISSTDGPDFDTLTSRRVNHRDVINSVDPELFIWIAASKQEQKVIEKMSQMTHTLEDLGINVSTGPIVDFRLKKHLKQDPCAGTVPLIYSSHFNGHKIDWPSNTSKKPNAIKKVKEVEKWLMDNGNYTLTKRFSSKEEKRRIVSTVFDSKQVNTDKIGFENHLNVFHKNKKGLRLTFAKGLSAYMNSTIVDNYFRIFSGHTQVNSTDLRNMLYPSHDQIIAIGKKVKSRNMDQERIDLLIEEVLFTSPTT